jgi:arylsulfatase A-like enzyme
MKKQPNIIFVLTDDQGYGDLGCTGNPIIDTPNINNFYDESARLTNFHVGPTCAPTRAGLMTGHYANSTGVWHTVGGRSLLRREEWTLAQALKENGYQTGIFGKWHLGDEYPYRPLDRGFEKSIVHGGGGISQTPDYWGNDYFDDTYFVNGIPQKFEGYCTDVFFREGIKFIEENKEKPFFCYIATNAPHSPYNVDSKYSDKYQGKVPDDRARFYGMIENIDENFGVLKNRLKELKLEDDTILIFMTDNGSSGGSTLDSMGFVKEGYNAGLRGKKDSEYDGGHRVPFFIRWQGSDIQQGKDINTLTANVDFMPTLLDLCGVDVGKREFNGKSIVSLLTANKEEWEERALVTDSQRIAYPAKWRKSVVMTDRWRLVNGKELYDINADREQRHNVSAAHPEVVKQLRCEYEKWWDIVSTQFDVEVPIVVGEKATSFTSHDLRSEEATNVAWDQILIRQGYSDDGYWEIEVEEEGTYQIELRRWPKSENRPITQGIAGDDIEFSREFIQEKNWARYTGGEEIKAKTALIAIQGHEEKVEVSDNDISSVFKVNLIKGATYLKAWFNDKKGNCITSAYYIDITKID